MQFLHLPRHPPHEPEQLYEHIEEQRPLHLPEQLEEHPPQPTAQFPEHDEEHLPVHLLEQLP